MSINQLSSYLSETVWWTQLQRQQHPLMEPIPTHPSSSSKPDPSWIPQLGHQRQAWLKSHNFQEPTSMFPHPNTPMTFNLNNDDNDEELDDQNPENPTHQEEIQELGKEQQSADETEKEPMFEKPLTPSDVGKLNRLVIPKQHAEKYFPLSGDSGLLLSFEDESGKCWRFRYSYWNSSQSYVLTKGWSRYVKEKRLDAGDVVLFERHKDDYGRLFIGWRRRGAAAQDSSGGLGVGAQHSNSGSGPGWTRVFYSAHPYPTHHHHPLPYQTDCPHAEVPNQNQTTPAGSSRILRLFGVNLECQQPEESEPSTPDGSSLSSQGPAYGQNLHSYHQPAAYSSSDPQAHMDITFSRDVNYQVRNRRG